MAKQMYLGVGNVAHKSKKVYFGVNNIARKVKKMYIGDENNKARLFFSSGLGLIVGGQGHFGYYTDNGTSWTESNKITTVQSGVTGWAAAYGNGTFVVVGGGSAHMYSKDGISWTAISALDGKYLYDVAFCKDRFMAVGDSGISYYSFDGISWTAMPTLGGDIKSVCYNADNDIIVVCRDSDDDEYASFARCARDAASWTRSVYGVSSNSRLPSSRSLIWDGTRYLMALQSSIYRNYSATLDSQWTEVSTISGSYKINRMNLLANGRIGIVGVYGRCQILDSDLNVTDCEFTHGTRELKDIIEYNGNVYICAYSNPAEIYKLVGDAWQSILSREYVSGNYVYFNYFCHGQE